MGNYALSGTYQDGHMDEAPILRPSLAEMDDLRTYLARASPLAERYGGVRIDPPAGWNPPPLALCDHSRFFVRVQSLPAAPLPERHSGDARIREPAVFPGSPKPVSLAKYRAKANRFHTWLCEEIFKGAYAGSSSSKKEQTKGAGLHWCYGGKRVTKSFAPARSHSGSSDTSISGQSSRNDGLPLRSRVARGRSLPSSARRERFLDGSIRQTKGIQKRGNRIPAGNEVLAIGHEVPCADPADAPPRISVAEANANNDDWADEDMNRPSSTDTRMTDAPKTGSAHLPSNTSDPYAVSRHSACASRVFVDQAQSQSPSDSIDLLIRPECKDPPSNGTSSGSPEADLLVSCSKQLSDVRHELGDPSNSRLKRRKRPRGSVNAAGRSAEFAAESSSCGALDRIPANVIEEKFWDVFFNGINGHEVELAYGVDVEAEGPYNVLGTAAVDSDEFCCKKSEEGSFSRDSMCPRWHVGNINSTGVLRHLPRMPGINHSMYYIGQVFTRFCWHTEDAFLSALSYLHNPSADKVWYVVPSSSAQAFEVYAAQEIFAPEMQVGGASGHSLLMTKTTMFDPRNASRHGIPVYKVVQKPGTFVYTGPRAYHCGFNCGFNIAESVNFAMPSWLPYGRQASTLARACHRPLCIPREFVVFHEALALMESSAADRHFPRFSRQTVRDAGRHSHATRPGADEQQNLRASDATYLATELLILIDEGECAISEFVKKTSCLISEGSASLSADLRGASDFYPTHCADLNQSFGNGAGMRCCICGHSSHFYSAICGTCLDGGETARCPQHFQIGGPICSIPGHRPMVIRRHSPVLLLDLLASCEKIAGIRVTPETIVKRNASYVRFWETRSLPLHVPKSRAPIYLRLYLPSPRG